ncbi:MAG: peroxiredoxin [Planctomycetota bacterium]
MSNQPIRIGAKLPDATLRVMTPEGPAAKTTAEFFAGRKVALFAVPGAFTPTCNNEHLPSFVEHAAEIKAKGVAEIACVAVNDPFVMGAWAQASGAGDAITFLSDGNAEFTNAIGMAFDGSGFGLGTRSLRYAMIVNDGTVTAMRVEESPGTCDVTSGGKLLADLA